MDVELVIDRPERWWPNGLGPPTLYAIDAALSIEGAPKGTRRTRVGLRTLEVVHRRDAQGKGFSVSVNGAPVFMKGANYIPSDSFPSRVTKERYRWLLESAARANMNMLRVWGGGIYEDDRFYELCDELGLLVWQDFIFACSMYPGDVDFVENVREEAIQIVRRLRNHPCLALWAGNNEIEVAWQKWGWQRKFDLSVEAQRKLWDDYRRLFHELLPRVVAEEDPGRFYTRSSPSANDDVIPADTLGYGDMHYWGVWHAEEPYTKYADHVSRFMSEYGFQSFPELSTVSRYAAPADHAIDSAVMLAHQRHPRGNQLIRTYMERDFRTPKNFESFLYASQLLQAVIIRYAAEAHRRRMPYNAGSLYWQLDDCWPVASWSGIDYFGRWKALHYFARRFFAPVLVSTTEEDGIVKVYLVSDRREDLEARLLLRVVDFDGRETWRDERRVRVASNASTVHFEGPGPTLLAGSPKERAVFVAELFEGARRLGRSLHYFVRWKDLALDDPELRVEAASAGGRGAGEGVLLAVSARKLAVGVRVAPIGPGGGALSEEGPAYAAACKEGKGATGHKGDTGDKGNTGDGMPSDNYFDLLPGETVPLVWAGVTGRGYRAISLRDSY
ncbi:MAG: glycoside hydrolase family 2 protein [Myxococcales bacterium]|nr:glycoside hydrolase family 2 protein [Myxococcales bacterium]